VRALWLACALVATASHADGAVHTLWELHGKHNTVYLLGSIHVLREADYPLAPPLLAAYSNSQALVMEINLKDLDMSELRNEMLQSALLPEGRTLADVMGRARYARAAASARLLGIDLANFDRFAPWFVAEAISQTQLAAQGFSAESGVEMFFLGKAQADGKAVAGLETAHDQIALFEHMTPETQAEYLDSSLKEARDLPREASEMVRAWQRGDTEWFRGELRHEFGHDPALFDSLLGARNRKWLPQIEALLDQDRNYLVIVGTGHLVGRDSVIALLKRDGIAAIQK
jgi:uncharacterized protein YbaP (TraB family)